MKEQPLVSHSTLPIAKAPGDRGGRRRTPLNNHKFAIGAATAVLLVALRLGLGYHFLYEGVWKIKHADEFGATAELYLTQAKGPVAGLFYGMVPDIDARQRLNLRVEVDSKGNRLGKSDVLKKRWDDVRQRFVDYYRPSIAAGDEAKQAHATLETRAQLTSDEFLQAAEKYLGENADEIATYFAALERFENDPERSQGAPFQQQQRWQQMQKLRGEAKGWIAELEAREQSLHNQLHGLLVDELRQKGPVPPSWSPFAWSRIEQIIFAVTYGLTAIGFCLVVGLFTRLSALGGAAFMCFVVMTQPAWPTIYPPDPGVVGHALLVNKDFIEMLALLVIASSTVGRWGGLDYFLHHLVFEPLLSKRIRKGEVKS